MSSSWEPLQPSEPGVDLFGEPIREHPNVDAQIPAGIEITPIIPATPARPRMAEPDVKKGGLFPRGGKKERDAVAAQQREALREYTLRKDRQSIIDHVKAWRGHTPTIIVGNSKGGVGKTITSLLLAQAFASMHISVAVIDNNEEGNQRNRIPNSPDGDTQTIDHLAELVAADAQLDLALLRKMMLWQPEGYWALPSVTGQTRMVDGKTSKWAFIQPAIWSEIHEAIRANFDLVIVDSGTSQRASNHEAAFDVADLLVAPTRWDNDAMPGMARLIADKWQQGYRSLAMAPLIVELIIRDDEKVRRAKNFPILEETYPGALIAPLPFDKHLASAEPVLWENLEPMTQHAAIHMAALACEALDKVAGLRERNSEV
jgi:cellulose biosynthesis protein BcsQ